LISRFKSRIGLLTCAFWLIISGFEAEHFLSGMMDMQPAFHYLPFAAGLLFGWPACFGCICYGTAISHNLLGVDLYPKLKCSGKRDDQ
jgi:hypothetical protein